MIKIDDHKLCVLYTKMVTELGEKYTKGCWKFITIFLKGDNRKIDEADDTVNRIWKECVEGKASLLEFLKALKEYKEICIRAFTRYKNRNHMKNIGNNR